MIILNEFYEWIHKRSLFNEGHKFVLVDYDEVEPLEAGIAVDLAADLI